MRAIRLLICAGYWGLLTVLLLTPIPATTIGLPKAAAFPGIGIGIHLLYHRRPGVLLRSLNSAGCQ